MAFDTTETRTRALELAQRYGDLPRIALELAAVLSSRIIPRLVCRGDGPGTLPRPEEG
jgi:hypothetical protein